MKSRRSVHPHVCGEIAAIVVQHGKHFGSPPRVWGNLSACSQRRTPRARFTPTCVGKSEISGEFAANGAVHPHVCGEIDGLLPVRAVLTVHPHVCGEIAFVSRLRIHAPTVHPHVCGEIINHRLPVPSRPGSPPRVWGNHRAAGGVMIAAPVHPHVCGEILVMRFERQRAQRFTPTCVGKSSIALRPLLTAIGSPPRVWGNLLSAMARGRRRRFTPTCVGKSREDVLRSAASSVHPHVCGEIGTTWPARCAPTGSPPRVWGNLRL